MNRMMSHKCQKYVLLFDFHDSSFIRSAPHTFGTSTGCKKFRGQHDTVAHWLILFPPTKRVWIWFLAQALYLLCIHFNVITELAAGSVSATGCIFQKQDSFLFSLPHLCLGNKKYREAGLSSGSLPSTTSVGQIPFWCWILNTGKDMSLLPESLRC